MQIWEHTVCYKSFKNIPIYNKADKGPRTVLMKDCHKNGKKKHFKDNNSFSIKKIVGSTLELSPKVFFSLDKYQFKNMG